MSRLRGAGCLSRYRRCNNGSCLVAWTHYPVSSRDDNATPTSDPERGPRIQRPHFCSTVSRGFASSGIDEETTTPAKKTVDAMVVLKVRSGSTSKQSTAYSF